MPDILANSKAMEEHPTTNLEFDKSWWREVSSVTVIGKFAYFATIAKYVSLD
jgi:hypothetical protein